MTPVASCKAQKPSAELMTEFQCRAADADSTKEEPTAQDVHSHCRGPRRVSHPTVANTVVHPLHVTHQSLPQLQNSTQGRRIACRHAQAVPRVLQVGTHVARAALDHSEASPCNIRPHHTIRSTTSIGVVSGRGLTSSGRIHPPATGMQQPRTALALRCINSSHASGGLLPVGQRLPSYQPIPVWGVP
jgi:hypothetical protein